MLRPGDKRRAKRDRHDSVVELFGADGALLATGRLADHSETGMSFSSPEKFSVGDGIKARLRLLEKGVLEAEGAVVWARLQAGRQLYGVRFSSVKRVHPTGEFKGER